MAVDEIIEQLESLAAGELRRLKTAIEARLAGPTMTEEEFEIQMERRGLLTRPTPGPPAELDIELPVEIEGEPLSEQLLRERR